MLFSVRDEGAGMCVVYENETGTDEQIKIKQQCEYA